MTAPLNQHQFTPETRAEHAHTFAAANEQYSTPEGARFQCGTASHAFLRHIGVTYDTYGESGEAEAPKADRWHMYAVVNTTKGRFAVDHTARQYDESQPYPVVQPLRKHRAWVRSL